MRNSARLTLSLTAAAALLGALALPASAATADTPVTASIPTGTLSITAPTASVGLGSVPPGTTSSPTDLGTVTVTDDRAGTAGWVATASITAFTGTGTTPPTLPATAARYTAAAATVTGTATVTEAGTVNDISSAVTVQTADAVTGNNTATWNPTLQIVAPSDALADTYTATITHSVS